MSTFELFAMSVVGIACGSIIGQWLVKGDLLSRFGWVAVGAMPGAATMAGEPWYMLTMLAVVPLLLLRRQKVAGKVSG